MHYAADWEQTKQRFNAWWQGKKMDRPMLRIEAERSTPLDPETTMVEPATAEAHHLDPALQVARLRDHYRRFQPMAEAYFSLDLNIGPGSIATYLGAKPVFAMDTIWYEECIHDYREFGDLHYNPNNPWLKRHLDIIRQAHDLAQGDFAVNIPDLIENIDILAALRGPQPTCYDLYDEADTVKRLIGQIDDCYFPYYDAFYDIVKTADGSSSYTAFSIWGPGRTAKVQCDFSAMISPDQFREFVQPSLIRQCRDLDSVLYHLDGTDAIKHVPALMEIEGVKALQWTAGAGKPDGASPQWFDLYRQVRQAGKSLWIMVYDGEYADWVANADRLVRAIGSDCLYLLFPAMTEEQAKRLIDHAHRQWR
jgi:hypothetical protein